MENNYLNTRPLYQLAPMIERGDISPVDLVEAFLNQIEKTNDVLKTYIHVIAEKARLAAKASADQIKNGNYLGVLHGLPYACKDMFLTKNIQTTGGSKVLADWIPDTDADSIQRLNASGGILLGKLNQHEFAYGATGDNKHFGTVPNPWDKSCFAGGSSSGSAAAVAAGLAAYTLGTDTGGSTRAPASLCGIVGLKPTYGRVNTKGVIPFSWSLDHIGIFTRRVLDAAWVFEALSRDARSAPVATGTIANSFSKFSSDSFDKLRIGIPQSFFFEKTDPEIVTSVQSVIRACRFGKAELIDVDLPPMDTMRSVSLLVQLPEMLSYHSRYLPKKKELYGEDIRAGMALGQFILAEHYVRAKRMIQEYRTKMAETFETVDIIITPTCPITAPAMGTRFVTIGNEEEPVGNAITRFTSFFNMTGNPAISIPCGIHSSGLPIGVQLVGRYFEENKLLNTAHVLENYIGTINGKLGNEICY